MKANKKNGVILIIIAILILISYLAFEFLFKNGTPKNETEPLPKIEVTSEEPTKLPDGADVPMYNIKIDINPEILKLMKVTKKEFDREIIIYANSSGYAAAELMKDMDEVFIDYAKKTITVPCYFKVGKHKGKFDVVYYYHSKKWNFIPF